MITGAARLRRAILVILGLYAVATVAVCVLFFRSTLAPQTQLIRMIVIGDYPRVGDEGVAYISGRRLNCASIPNTALYPASCEIAIAGKLLRVEANQVRATREFYVTGTCIAQYDGRKWPCSLNRGHVNMDGFAQLDDGWGLSETQLDAIRVRYWVENIPENTVVRLALGFVVCTTVVMAGGVFLLLARSERSKGVPLLGAIAAGLTVFPASFLVALFATAGLWD